MKSLLTLAFYNLTTAQLAEYNNYAHPPPSEIPQDIIDHMEEYILAKVIIHQMLVDGSGWSNFPEICPDCNISSDSDSDEDNLEPPCDSA